MVGRFMPLLWWSTPHIVADEVPIRLQCQDVIQSVLSLPPVRGLERVRYSAINSRRGKNRI